MPSRMAWSANRRECKSKKIPLGAGSQLDSFSLPGDWFPDRWSGVFKLSNREHHVALEPTVQRCPGARQVAPIGLEAARPTHNLFARGAMCSPPTLGSGGETRHRLYDELGAGKLDSVYFQSIPTDEAKRAGYFL